MTNISAAELDYLCSPKAVKERSEKILTWALSGNSNFEVHLEKIPEAAKLTLEVTKAAYPDFSKIPFHARWEHFNAGGVNRLAFFEKAILNFDSKEQARILLDLVIISVLLDAGAGPEWSYKDSSGQSLARSEGLAVASLEMFQKGAFSSNAQKAFQVDAAGLKGLTAEKLAKYFQVSASNPLVGLDSRAALLNRLGMQVEKQKAFFSQPRLGSLIDYWIENSIENQISSTFILKTLIKAFNGMWPARTTLNEIAFGDLWEHPHLKSQAKSAFEAYVPFHKLSQWLSYSCFYPLEKSGLQVTGAELLTGLPEYRNGGLFLDLGILKFKDSEKMKKSFKASDLEIIEWRALTVALLYRIAENIRQQTGLDEKTLPLGKILQGGTWAAGRKTAQKLRGGLPPLNIDSDGTVF